MKDPDQVREALESLEGNFELIRQLGQGATSVVYLLRDHALERDVAMKVIRGTLAGDDEAIARLQREARLVAQLTHPNIVKLYGTQRLPDGSFALLMEHVPGRNLKELLREEGAFPVPRATRVLADVASALAYAHRRRIVHRDVKPENIYIDEEVGAARLADFGVARPWDQDARLTLPGASLGTPAYMSPEQIDGLEVDGRSDVYSLGLVGYELLLGHHPWEGENVFTIIYRQKNDELPMEVLGLQEDSALAETLRMALEKNPAKRLESAGAFLERLSGTEASSTVDPSGTSRSYASKALEESLAPVDWGSVEATTEDFSGRSGGPEGDQARSDLPVLGAKKKKRRAPLLLALAGVTIVGTYGLLTWHPWAGAEADSEAFIPVSTPPGSQAETVGGGNPESALGPVGLSPAHDSVVIGPAGSVVPLSVRAVAADGTPMANSQVVFRVVEGDGVLEAEEATADADGGAEVNLKLPNRPGHVLVTAQVSGPDSFRTLLSATAEAGAPGRVVPILGNDQRGTPGTALPEAVGVRVVDDLGNPVPNAEVRFQVLQGGGQIAPGSTPTDEAGRAFARWTLGATPGTQMAAAVVPGAEDALLTFQATAVAPSRPEPEPTRPSPPEDPGPGALRTGPVTVVARTFAVGGTQVCHLVDGSAVCRGDNDRGQGGDRSLNGLVSLALGVAHGCGLDVTGGAWCWGANQFGQLGDGTTSDRRSAGGVETNVRYSALVGGLNHTCGLGPGGQASCWGRNVNGQLGIGSREDQSRPTAVAGNHSFLELAAGWNHTCGTTAGGGAFCWGANGSGQVGDGTQIDRVFPTAVAGSFQTLVAGANHTCGISGSEVRCWGDNDSGQLGDGTTQDRSSPVSVAGLPGTPIALAAGAVHTCALLTDRSVQCWGQNLHGQLGDGTTQNRSSPVPVTGGIEFVSIFAGGGVTCGFARDGGEYCWGLNQSGQLGDGTRTNRSSPTRVGGNLP